MIERLTSLFWDRVASLSIRDVIVAVAVALLAAGLLWFALALVGALRGVWRNVRLIHQQLSNIIGMLQRAGFRGARCSADWSDDADRTRLVTEGPAPTQFDWKRPE